MQSTNNITGSGIEFKILNPFHNYPILWKVFGCLKTHQIQRMKQLVYLMAGLILFFPIQQPNLSM